MASDDHRTAIHAVRWGTLRVGHRSSGLVPFPGAASGLQNADFPRQHRAAHGRWQCHLHGHVHDRMESAIHDRKGLTFGPVAHAGSESERRTEWRRWASIRAPPPGLPSQSVALERKVRDGRLSDGVTDSNFFVHSILKH